MNEVTRILEAIERGEQDAAEELFPIAYQELRRMAAQMMAGERDGHTLEATALVHEAYLRLAGDGSDGRHWNSRGHFFSAAAEAMRRILVDSARRKRSLKRGGDPVRETLSESHLAGAAPSEEILQVDEALEKLAREDAELAQVVKLRYFAGMTLDEIGELIGVSARTVGRQWAFARAWLYREISAAD